MNFITDILYWISTGLLVPVVVLLIFFFFRALLLIGSFFGQYMMMRRTSSLISKELDLLNKDNVRNLAEVLPKKNPSLAVIYIHRLLEADSLAIRQRLLSDYEIASDKEISISKTLIKMGPMLGLMGTLIPMGPALVGLSTGDIASMAYNMQVAFSTTVIGLFSAAIGFITLQAKQRWYLQDLTNLEFIAELLKENQEEK
ncbi:MAG: MotA/TolQ/ExbB proton channel family protein [Phocaeicola sp.]|nr:MotA/TolQ/ExbB proton channel family protein [Prevotellaceae bacterium]MDY5939124.1 MotA/TolQ/ExbB proton channel family protein [Phocaeicola sp.]